MSMIIITIQPNKVDRVDTEHDGGEAVEHHADVEAAVQAEPPEDEGAGGVCEGGEGGQRGRHAHVHAAVADQAEDAGRQQPAHAPRQGRRRCRRKARVCRSKNKIESKMMTL